MGRILPTDLEQLTLSQAMILLLPEECLTTVVSMTPQELASNGWIPASKIAPKSKCQTMQEAAELRRKAERETREATRRKRRRQR